MQKEEFKKRVYKFVLRLIKFIGTLDLKDVVCRVIADQLTRSGTSILSNYIEGYSSSSRKEFINYFAISLKSANESKVWLALLRDSGKCEKSEANYLLEELEEISKIFGASILTLKGKR
ncbi:MAG: four helix bundle protein [Candidatus Woesebacteria bacterium]|nr:MAG: four helix bundle protein [Candidatus Woesebacteria bacterium]